MAEIILNVIGILLILNLVLSLIILWKNKQPDLHQLSSDLAGSIEKFSNRLEANSKDDFSRSRDELNKNFKENREEVNAVFKNFQDSILQRLSETSQVQKNQLDTFAKQLSELNQTTDQRLNAMRDSIQNRLESIQKDNNLKLEKMRETVDEKLHKTLEQRLGESFKLVSERLELVQKGLGEMQTLAVGVGDLKKVLTNVKTKGVMGEYQLENILEQLLSPEQYEKNVKTKKYSDAIVEFAIKLPGRKDKNKQVWLPLDSKFPTTDFQLLMDAYDFADPVQIDKSKKQFAQSIKNSAKEIKEKYIDPPHTTDFAIMFLPIEGLYAEVLRDTGLFETLQRDFKVIITGPTTLSAILSSLQMGFRTLAIEKRSSEVWEILSAIKTEFGKFGVVLEKTQKKIQEASNVIDQAGQRSRAIERKLRNVEKLPGNKAQRFLENGEEDQLLFGEHWEMDEIDNKNDGKKMDQQ